jgi:uncharacterized protein involved in response to NO
MLFGFVAAAIAGFLLTAVPSWTGRRGFTGPPVMLLTATWVAARLLIATSNHWPAVLVAAADVGFLVTVGILILVTAIGVLSTMMMGVMTRASLGHTGRPLVVAPSTHRFSGRRGWMANQAN